MTEKGEDVKYVLNIWAKPFFVSFHNKNASGSLHFLRQTEKIFSSQDYLELSNRFPRQTWEEARLFFLKKEKK